MKLFKICITLLFSINLQAQKTICPDVEGAIDYPLICKYKNSCIVAYNESRFNQVTFPASKISYYRGI